MKAKEVLARYTVGERNFHRVNLRGQSFKGENLAGADFRGANIHGTNFTEANLTGANFQEARAGLQRRWLIVQLLFSLVLAVIAGFCSLFAGALVALIFDSGNLDNQIAGWVSLAILVVFYLVLFRQGLNAAFITLAVAFAVAGAVAGSVAFAVTGAVPGSVAGSVTGAVTGAVAFIVAFTVPFAVAFAFAVAGVLIILSAYITWQAMKGNKKYTFIKTLAVALAATGGTSFRQANLTEADFHQAILKNTDFRQAIITRTYWKDSQKLDLARLGDTYLSQKTVRELIFTNYGYKKAYVGANLRGVNLAGVNLEAANLKQANLAEANLRAANLKDTNLTEINAVATDFTNATFTGVCLEAWNIDHTTKLENIDCQFIFLLEHTNSQGHRERRPHGLNQVFQPGDFSKLYQELLNVVQLLIRDGLNPEAFQQAFQKIMQEHRGITPESIQEIKKKGEDVLVTLEVPTETDKGKLARDFEEAYQLRLEAEKSAALLESEKEHNQQITQLFSQFLTHQPQNLSINTSLKNKPVNKNTNDNRQFTVGDVDGDFKPVGSALNAGDVTISGTVAETINQLPSSPDSEKPGIKELLTQLQAAIEAEDNLDEEEKQEAREQLANLAQAGKESQEGGRKKLAKKAMIMLKGIAAGLPATAGLAKAVQELLPLIGKVLGF